MSRTRVCRVRNARTLLLNVSLMDSQRLASSPPMYSLLVQRRCTAHDASSSGEVKDCTHDMYQMQSGCRAVDSVQKQCDSRTYTG